MNDYPETFRDGDVCEGYVSTEGAKRREIWVKQIKEDLISAFHMDNAEAQSVLNEMKGMDIMAACGIA